MNGTFVVIAVDIWFCHGSAFRRSCPYTDYTYSTIENDQMKLLVSLTNSKFITEAMNLFQNNKNKRI